MSDLHVDTILFDLDGTLVDSLPDLAAACNGMREDLGMPALDNGTYSEYVGKGSEILVKRALINRRDDYEVDPALFEKAYPIFKQHYHRFNGQHSQLFPGVKEALAKLQSEGYIIGLVTNKPTEFTGPLLKAKGIDAFFKVIVCGDTCSRKKPHPDTIQYALEQLNKQPSQALFVGDSVNDAEGAANAGLPCVLFPYGYNEGTDVQNLKVSAIVNNIDALLTWIAQNTTRQDHDISLSTL